MDFSDQVAIVTGSSAGIGQAAAIGMAEGGAKLVINYSKSADAAEAVVAACKAAGGDAIAVQANVAEDANCKTLVEAAMDKWGRLDILVNNAGTTKFMGHDNLEGLDAADFEEIYALNLIGPYQMIKHARPFLKQADAPSCSEYFLRGWRARHWIFHCLCGVKRRVKLGDISLGALFGAGEHSRECRLPRLCGTDWFRNAFGDEVFEKISNAQKHTTPMGRAGGPDDIKGPILFFANRMSAHVTGQLMVVDAGMLLGMPFEIG